METLTERMDAAGRALTRLHELAINKNLSDIERDALIQRFKVCFEILWRCGKDYLRDREGLDAASPKKVIRFLREIGFFNSEETEHSLLMVDDRNLTAHTYDEHIAQKIALRIPDYEKLMQTWYHRMKD